jgi:hypothetical protein
MQALDRDFTDGWCLTVADRLSRWFAATGHARPAIGIIVTGV